MNITLVGAGNMGLAMTAYLSLSESNQVTLYTNKKILWNELMLEEVEGNLKKKAGFFDVTDNPQRAFSEADIVFCTYPAFLRKNFIEECGAFFHSDMILGFVPGYGGAEFFCRELIDRGVVVCGLQRVPYVARFSEEGSGITARILSKKKSLYCAAIPFHMTKIVSKQVENLLHIPCMPMQEYLAVTLAPSNPLLHITGLYNVFHNYKAGECYARPMRFYEEWTDDASRLLFRYDDEIQNICHNLSPLRLEEVVSLPVYYDAPTPERMTKKLKSIEAFQEVMVPLKEIDGRWIPDFNSRMFIEDFPYGVCIIKDFARIAHVDTPVVDLLLDFYHSLTGHRYFYGDGTYTEEIVHTGVPGIHDINTLEDVKEFYGN